MRSYGKSHLGPPTVVLSPPIFFGPKVTLDVMLPERLRGTVTRRRPTYLLSPPVVIGAGIAWHGPGTYLTAPNFLADRNRRRQARSRLRPPTVTTAAVAFFGPSTTFAPSPRQGRRANADVAAPIVVFVGGNLGWIGIQLAATRRPVAKSRLFAPAVVSTAGVFRGAKTPLAYSRHGQAKSRLEPPAVVGAGIAWHGPGTYLTRLRPTPRTLGVLRAPTVVLAQVYSLGPDVHLAPSKRGQPKAHLFAPTVIGAGVAWHGPGTYLTRLRPTPKTLIELRTPTVVLVAFLPSGPKVHAAYSRRGRPESRLRPPTVVFLAVEIYGPKQTLAYSRRGLPKSILRKPLGTDFVAPNLSPTLAPQKRGIAKSRLFPPAVIGAGIAWHGPGTYLTRPSRGKTAAGSLPRPSRLFSPPSTAPLSILRIREGQRSVSPALCAIRSTSQS